MKLKYITADGEVLCMGDMPDITPGPGESVVTVSFSIPDEPLNFYTFNGSALVRKEQTEIDKILSIQRFNRVTFQGDLLTAMVGGEFSSNSLRSEFAALDTFATNKDFAGMKQYVLWLISIGAAQTADYTAVNKATKNQGVDLDTF